MQNPMKKRLKTFGIDFGVAALIFSLVFVVYAQTVLTPMTLTGGIYPAAPSYTIWGEGSPTTYYAKDSYGNIDYSGTNKTTLIQTVENVVDDAGGIIYLKDVLFPSEVSLSSNVVVYEVYQGVVTWYNLNTTKHLSEVGIYERYFTDNAQGQTEIIHPRSIYYNGKTYIAYIGIDKTYSGSIWIHPYITYYDHINQTWHNVVQVGEGTMNDQHITPAIIIDKNGYIHVFWGAHSSSGGTAPKHSKSTNPEDISSWIAMSNVPITLSSYPNIIKTSDGTLYYFYRSRVSSSYEKWGWVTSTNEGVSWSSETFWLDMGNNEYPYAGNFEYDSTRQYVHTVWNRGNVTSWKRYNIYYAYLKLSDLHMYSVDGTDLGTTIDLTEAETNCKAYNSPSSDLENSQGTVHTSVSNGYPYLIWAVGGTTDTYQFARWTGATWTSPTNIAPVNSTYGNEFEDGDFKITVEGQLLFYGTVKPYSNTTAGYSWQFTLGVPYFRGGDLIEFISFDLGATWCVRTVIYHDTLGAYDAEVVLNGQPELEIIFGNVNIFYNDVAANRAFTYMYAWGDNGYVYKNWKW